jgi:hypothetical protein
VTLSLRIGLVAAALAAGIAVAVSVGPAPGAPACRLPTGAPNTATGGTVNTSPPSPGSAPPGAITSSTEPPGGGGGPTPPTSTGAPGGDTGTGTTNQSTDSGCPPGPNASAAAKAQTYGQYCRAQSRKRVGASSPYETCLTAMARIALGTLKLGPATTPRKACKAESRRRIGSARRTPYALCVASGRKLAAVLRRAVPR